MNTLGFGHGQSVSPGNFCLKGKLLFESMSPIESICVLRRLPGDSVNCKGAKSLREGNRIQFSPIYTASWLDPPDTLKLKWPFIVVQL